MSRKPLVAITLVVFFVTQALGHIPPGAQLVQGRMTGGGSIFLGPSDLVLNHDGAANFRVTHGFELNCSPDKVPNNLEINIHDPGGDLKGKFKLDTLTWAACWMDPAFSPNPPDAPFNSYFGRGVGRWNGESGFCIQWLFTDAGEPGVNDRITYILIWTGGAFCPVGDPNAPETFILSIPDPGHTLTNGDHQAHKDTK